METILELLRSFWNWLFESKGRASGPWPRNLPLLQLASRGLFGIICDRYTLAQAGLNMLFIGAPGAGKTSVMKDVVRSALRAASGAAVLVYKREATQDFVTCATEEGRKKDLIVMRPGKTPIDPPTHAVNILSYESQRHGEQGAVVEEIAHVIHEVMSALSARYGNGKNDDEWQRMALRLLKNVLEIQIDAYGSVELKDTIEFVQHLPTSASDVERNGLHTSIQEALVLAKDRCGKERGYELQMAENYITQEWPNLSPRTAASISTTLLTSLDSMSRHPLRQLFFEGTTFSPEDALTKGKLIVLDLPVDTHGEVARVGGVILKFVMQRALKARSEEESWRRPVLIVADEVQAFVSRNDAEFANVSRSVRGIMLMATQNLPNLLSTMGGDATGKADVDSLVSNAQTRVVTLTSDPTTATWLSDSPPLGKVLKRRFNRNDGVNISGDGTIAFNQGGGYSEVIDYEVQPNAWGTLRSGGPENNRFVEAVITGTFMGGRRFKVNGRRYLRVKFDQTGKNRWGAVRIIAPRIRVRSERSER